MTTFIAGEDVKAYRFESARDAIDAVRAFEDSTPEDWEYKIECIGDGTWVVRLTRVGGKPFRGRLVQDRGAVS